MKQILVALFAGLILGLYGSPAKPHVPGPEQYVDGWRYSQVGDKGYLCHESRGCFVGDDTPFGRLYWTGFDQFWQPKMNPDSPRGGDRIMGVYADFLAHTTVIDKTEPQVACDRIAYNELVRLRDSFDPETPAGFEARDEVQTIGPFTGDVYCSYTLTIVDPDGTQITTALIPYFAIPAMIETAINAVCNGTITGWSDGDISVSGYALDEGDVTLTFSGNSVTQQNFGLTVVTVFDVIGSSEPGDVTVIQSGQRQRYAWAVMQNLGLYGSPPNQGEALPSLATLATSPGENPRWPSASLRRALAWQAAIDDGNPMLRTQLERLFNVQR